MAGYSGVPLPRKLGIKERSRILILDAPESFSETLGELPPDVEIMGPDANGLDLIVFFCDNEAELRRRFAAIATGLDPAGMLWIAWPKKASRVPTDLTEDVVRIVGLEAGLVDVKVCAIDAVRSGLKFVRRLKDRPTATDRSGNHHNSKMSV